MKIAVLIKQVPVGEVGVDPVTQTLVRQSGEGMVNPMDLHAIEAAMEIKDTLGAEVWVLTMGPPEAEKALRTALAMGCDEGCLVTDRAFGGADTIATAKVLAAALRHCGGFDLVLAGAQSADGATGQVGPMVAEYMGLPHVCEIQSIHCDSPETGIQVVRRAGGRQVRLGVALPALFTISFGANSPRLTTLRSQRAAKAKPVTILTNAELGMDAKDVGLAGSPTLVVDAYQPKSTRQAVFLTGTDAEIAEQIMALVAKEKEAH